MISAESSGGVSSSTFFTWSTMRVTDWFMASAACAVVIVRFFGRPVSISRPRISISSLRASGNAAPMFILISSAVRSPIIMLNSRFT